MRNKSHCRLPICALATSFALCFVSCNQCVQYNTAIQALQVAKPYLPSDSLEHVRIAEQILGFTAYACYLADMEQQRIAEQKARELQRRKTKSRYYAVTVPSRSSASSTKGRRTVMRVDTQTGKVVDGSAIVIDSEQDSIPCKGTTAEIIG